MDAKAENPGVGAMSTNKTAKEDALRCRGTLFCKFTKCAQRCLYNARADSR